MKNIQGLSTKDAKKSASEHGTNTLSEKTKRTFLQTYWEKYDDPIIIVLLIALGINVMFTFIGKVDWHECAGILLSVIISTFVSAVSEYSNENTFCRLRKEASRAKCKVWRDGNLTEILISEIVIGDYVLLQPGDIIPADGRIIDGKINVDQSSLSGESTETEKTSSDKIPKKSLFSDFWNCHNLYRGSVVCSGEAVMLVDDIGDNTVYGKLTRDAQEDMRESPLTVKLSNLAKSISRFGCVSAIIIVILSFANNAFITTGFNPALIANYFADTAQVVSDIVSSVIIGIIVIVVAVPEGLPLMIAIVCSLNMKKMLNSNILVRRLIGIETAGGINILFTDKTGTITMGKPKVVYLCNEKGREYNSFSAINNENKAFGETLAKSIVINSSAKFSKDKIIGGNATERALLEFIGKENGDLGNINIIKTVPFSSEKKFSMTACGHTTFIKGAPELIVPKCTNCSVELLKNKMDIASARAMRLLAIAKTDCIHTGENLPDEMTLIAVAAIRDDIRPESKSAIKEVQNAGIQVVMITGDRSETAVTIAKESGIMSRNDICITSDRLASMTDREVSKILPRLRVVARALPDDKSRLVKIAQDNNQVVGMTGDGVNDASALKLADVGFAMGGGTEAAAAAADIVILDDNFLSIKNAVLYGRTIYNSIKKFIKFQLTINVAAVAVSMFGPIIGIDKPLDISQMIWTNLMIDSLAAIAFGGEPALNRYMNEKPRRRDEDILDKKMWSSIITDGLYICVLSMLFFILPIVKDVFCYDSNPIYFYTGYFCFFIFISIFNAFNARSDSIDLLGHLALNKQFIIIMTGIAFVQWAMTYVGGNMFRTAPLTFYQWLWVIIPALTIIPVDIIRKSIMGNS